jgi:hypothetical protein
MVRINQFSIKYIHTWKCHDETLYIGILNKENCLFFSENGGQEGKTGHVWGLAPVGGGRI